MPSTPGLFKVLSPLLLIFGSVPVADPQLCNCNDTITDATCGSFNKSVLDSLNDSNATCAAAQLRSCTTYNTKPNGTCIGGFIFQDINVSNGTKPNITWNLTKVNTNVTCFDASLIVKSYYANFQLVYDNITNTSAYVACPEFGTCLETGLCAAQNSGPLCAVCYVSPWSSSRHRHGEPCASCDPWGVYPWLKLFGFYVLAIAFVAILIAVQYWVTAAPLSSPAALGEVRARDREIRRKKKLALIAQAEKRGERPPAEALLEEPPDDPKDQTSLSPVLLAAVVRQILDHHHLTCIAWSYSSTALVFPESSRWLAQLIRTDYWALLDLECVAVSFFVDDVLYFALTCIPLHMVLAYVCARFIGYEDACGCCMSAEQSMLATADPDQIAAFFDKVDVDGDGKLTRDELLEAMTASKAAASGLPSSGTLALGALTVFNFFQMPLFNKNFLYNLDCVEVDGESVMRVDLREFCTGLDYAGRVTMSIAGLGIFSFGSVVLALFLIWRARAGTIASTDEQGNIDQDLESAYGFLLSGLKGNCWWFGCYKMFLKELLPVLIVLGCRGTAPMDFGVSEAPGILVLLGMVCSFLSEYLDPFSHMYSSQLKMLERLSWVSFIAGPLTQLIITNEVAIAVQPIDTTVTTTVFTKMETVSGQWTKQASLPLEWGLILGSLSLYFLPILAGMYFLVKEQRGWFKMPQVNIEVAERIHITIPKNPKERPALVILLSQLFEASLGMVMRTSNSENEHLSPAACIEAALLIAMSEDASYYGDANAGKHHVLNVERESILGTIGLFDNDQEVREMNLYRALLNAGTLAETCLVKGQPGTMKASSGQAVAEMNREEVNQMVQVLVNDDTTEAHYITLNFSLERVELRSLGFKEGLGEKKTRPGVQRSLNRSLAVAVAAPEKDVDVQVYPVGVDRALCVAIIECRTESEISNREEWLRTALGTKEARTRWSAGLEADLARVGAIASSEGKLSVRFNKGSKPQRSTKEGAEMMAQAAVRAAGSLQDKFLENTGGSKLTVPVSAAGGSSLAPSPVGRPQAMSEDSSTRSEQATPGRKPRRASSQTSPRPSPRPGSEASVPVRRPKKKAQSTASGVGAASLYDA